MIYLLVKTSKVVAFLSLVIGTILFLLQISGPFSVLWILGLIYMIIAISVNIILVVALIISTFSHPEMKKELLDALGLILLNIPVAILYFCILTNIFS
jgi:hypothetical protein